MDALNDTVASLKHWQVEPRPLALSLGAIVLLVLSVGMLWPTSGPVKPPMLSDTIPYVTNTYQYMANMNKFLARAA